MVVVEQHHLRGTPGLAAALDRPGGCVCAAHEADGPARLAAAAEEFLAASDARQVDAGAGATLEDAALFDVPAQDRFHLVVDRQDEARGRLLRHARDPDVEPHRAVERPALMKQQPRELGLERVRFIAPGEVPVCLAPAADGSSDASEHLAQRRLAARRADGAAEVLLGDDVGGGDAPRHRKLHAQLFEGDAAVDEVSETRIAALPRDRLQRILPRRGEVPGDAGGCGV